jgi:hypothetical protein
MATRGFQLFLSDLRIRPQRQYGDQYGDKPINRPVYNFF